MLADLVIGCNDDAARHAPGYLTSYVLDPRTGELAYIDAVDTGGFPVPDYGAAAGNIYHISYPSLYHTTNPEHQHTAHTSLLETLPA